jgi:hypothetical protein
MYRMDVGTWSEKSRDGYNLVDAVSRCTVQVRYSFCSIHFQAC